MHSAYRKLLRDEVYLLARTGSNVHGQPVFAGPGDGPFRARVVWDEQLIQGPDGEEVQSAGTVTIDHNIMPATKGAIQLADQDYRHVLKTHGPKVGSKIDHLKVWFGPQLDPSQVQV